MFVFLGLIKGDKIEKFVFESIQIDYNLKRLYCTTTNDGSKIEMLMKLIAYFTIKQVFIVSLLRNLYQ